MDPVNRLVNATDILQERYEELTEAATSARGNAAALRSRADEEDAVAKMQEAIADSVKWAIKKLDVK